jgi:glycosyltransferase involved in cell wall biosynthesis
MRLLFVADGRSPIAIHWMRFFAERGDEVHLATTFRCAPDIPLRSVDFAPVAYSQARSGSARPHAGLTKTARLQRALRYFLGPLTISRSARVLRRIQDRVRPDLVHAMRIPFEGMLAADAYDGTPLLISIWGNDLTLHAPSNPLMRHYTRWALGAADALHADCRRDIRLGKSWGFASSLPTCIVPGNGGVRLEIFHAPPTPVEAPLIVNPRGARSYVRTEIFMQAAALVLAQRSDARFLCPALAGDREALEWIESLGIGQAVELLPRLSETEMADLLRRAQVLVSPSVHDGTPNSLLEGMACGCLPVAGDLESIREWITPGKNGLLADATSARDLADAMLEALVNKDLRLEAAGLNRSIVLERAEYTRCMRRVDTFYQRIISSR